MTNEIKDSFYDEVLFMRWSNAKRKQWTPTIIFLSTVKICDHPQDPHNICRCRLMAIVQRYFML